MWKAVCRDEAECWGERWVQSPLFWRGQGKGSLTATLGDGQGRAAGPGSGGAQWEVRSAAPRGLQPESGSPEQRCSVSREGVQNTRLQLPEATGRAEWKVWELVSDIFVALWGDDYEVYLVLFHLRSYLVLRTALCRDH